MTKPVPRDGSADTPGEPDICRWIDRPRHTWQVPATGGYPITLRCYGQRDGPRVVVSHGNGLAVDAFAGFCRILARHCEVVVFDMRGHGRNDPPGPVDDHWATFIADLRHVYAGIRAELGERPTFGALHSLSAACTLLQAARTGEPWDGLVLFEPPLHPPRGEALTQEYLAEHHILAAQAARRRERFGDPADLAARYRQSRQFAGVSDDTLTLLAASTLRPAPDGGYLLTCPPAFEAKTFQVQAIEGTFAELRNVGVPTVLAVGAPQEVRAKVSVLARIAYRVAAETGFRVRQMPGASHFMQLEQPAAAADIVLDMVFANGGAKPAEKETVQNATS